MEGLWGSPFCPFCVVYRLCASPTHIHRVQGCPRLRFVQEHLDSIGSRSGE